MICVVMAEGRNRQIQPVVERVYEYSSTVSDTLEDLTSFSYLKYLLSSNQRNSIMYAIPRLYNIARGEKRLFFGEHFVRRRFHERGEDQTEDIARVSTVRRRRTLLPNLHSYLTPHIYEATIINDHILSPFNRLNRRYYRYNIIYCSDSIAQMEFIPRISNTQAITGQALVHIATGRVISCYLEGEYDLVTYELKMEMGDEGVQSLLPKHSELYTRFRFVGNHIDIHYDAIYFLPDSSSFVPLNDEATERQFVERHRPLPLSFTERTLLADYDSVQTARRNAPPRIRKKNFAKDVLWDIFGENLLHRIRGRFGTDDRGYYRLSPLLNPLYFSYSGRRGLTYRLKGNFSYQLGPNSQVGFNPRVGYSFKLRQLFVEAPLTYTFDRSHDGFLRFTYKDGNQITNSTVIDILKKERGDSVDWDKLDLQYFKHQQIDLTVHYDLTPHIGLEAGILKNRWTAISDNVITAGKPQVYQSVSFHTELSLRPVLLNASVVTVDYERTLSGLSKDYMNYERWEFDFSYLKFLPGIRSLSLRAGGGFYTTHTSGIYFLDYANFRENNIPGGWNDEWSGEFELLHRNYYNASPYYLRANVTYESPLFLMSWIPVIGQTMEKERLYVSALHANKISHYFELGYGFTNRLISMGLFTAFKNGRYDGVGVKLGFELFDGW